MKKREILMKSRTLTENHNRLKPKIPTPDIKVIYQYAKTVVAFNQLTKRPIILSRNHQDKEE